MNRFAWGSLVALGVGLSSASAQVGVYTPPRAPISPYLNLNRGGNPAINYYGLVRPQFDTSRALQNVQTQLQSMSSQVAPTQPVADPTFVPTTGHPVTFLNSSHFFPVTGRTGSGQASGFGSGQGLNPFYPASTTGIRR